LALDVAAGVSPPVFIAHGRSDPIVGFDAAGRMRRVLEANGFPVTLHAHPGDHGIDPCTVRELRAFLLEDGG
jgi:predicted esterase